MDAELGREIQVEKIKLKGCTLKTECSPSNIIILMEFYKLLLEVSVEQSLEALAVASLIL